MATHLLYREIKPTPALQDYIYSYWQFEYRPEGPGEPLQHSVLPDGCVSLIFFSFPLLESPAVIFSGPRTRLLNVPVPAGSSYLGIRFLPAAFAPIFNFSPIEIKEDSIDALKLLHPFALEPLMESLKPGFDNFSLLDTIFQSGLEPMQIEIDEKVRQAVRLILEAKGNIKVSELAKKVWLSERQFQRRFKFQVGLTPKEFIRVRRIRQSVIQLLLREEKIQDVLFDSGYFDPAHFAHDFGQISGTTPGMFAKYIARIKHVGVE